MADPVDPHLLAFIINLAQLFLIAFGIMIVGAAIVYTALFWKGNFDGRSIARILHQTDVPKLATIILIVLSASLLGLLRIIQGEAIIALLSGIAGYVLGNRAAPAKDGAAAE
jgi:hypothetical protein